VALQSDGSWSEYDDVTVEAGSQIQQDVILNLTTASLYLLAANKVTDRIIKLICVHVDVCQHLNLLRTKTWPVNFFSLPFNSKADKFTVDLAHLEVLKSGQLIQLCFVARRSCHCSVRGSFTKLYDCSICIYSELKVYAPHCIH